MNTVGFASLVSVSDNNAYSLVANTTTDTSSLSTAKIPFGPVDLLLYKTTANLYVLPVVKDTSPGAKTTTTIYGTRYNCRVSGNGYALTMVTSSNGTAGSKSIILNGMGLATNASGELLTVAVSNLSGITAIDSAATSDTYYQIGTRPIRFAKINGNYYIVTCDMA